jgi:hypothetical protein
VTPSAFAVLRLIHQLELCGRLDRELSWPRASQNAIDVGRRPSVFARRLDDFAVNGNLPQATERAFLDCQLEEDALYTTAVASAPGNTQAIALVRAAVEQLKANLKADLMAVPPTVPKE